MTRRSIVTKVIAGAGAALLLLAPAAQANEAGTADATKVCLNGMPPPAGIDQWCVLVMEGNVIVGFESNRYGSTGNDASWSVGVCSAPSPQWVEVCTHLPR